MMILSTRLTWVYRITGIALPVWVGLYGVAKVIGSRGEARVVIGMGMCLAIVVLAGIAMISLAIVSLDDSSLHVRLLWREFRLPLSAIVGVRVPPLMGMGGAPLVSVVLRTEDGRKQRIRFVARFRIDSWAGKHPDVELLRRRIDEQHTSPDSRGQHA